MMEVLITSVGALLAPILAKSPFCDIFPFAEDNWDPKFQTPYLPKKSCQIGRNRKASTHAKRWQEKESRKYACMRTS